MHYNAASIRPPKKTKDFGSDRDTDASIADDTMKCHAIRNDAIRYDAIHY